MLNRYFVETPLTTDRATLDGAEAHHLLHVMRAEPGTEVALFDGSGDEFTAVVAKCTRREVELEVLARRTVDRESPRPVTLAVALPKGDRQRWLIEKATELGVARIVPLVTARGVAQPTSSALAKLRRAVIEASKQCGRNRLLEITAPQTLAELTNATPDDALRLLAHPGGTALDAAALPESTVIYAAIGPEGGFTDDEVAMAAAAGWTTVALGSRILRIETAALLIAARMITT